MTDNNSLVLTKVHDLIKLLLPPDTPSGLIERHQSSSMRTLSSGIGQTTRIEDENTILKAFQRSLQKKVDEQNISKHAASEMSLRLQELVQRLSKTKTLQKRFAVCHLLTRVTKPTEKQFGTLLSNDFLNKSHHQQQTDRWRTTSNENTAKKGAMEIENSMASTAVGKTTMVAGRPEPQQSNATKLAAKVANKGNPALKVSENDLLRDVLFAFQGIDGNYIYYSAHDDNFLIKPTVTLSAPVQKILLQLCEMGWLYKKVMGFIAEANFELRGLVHQSLCIALKEELNEYYRLIAVLENLRETEDDHSRASFLVEEQPGSRSLNLRKLYLWSMEPFERLKWMSIFCDACRKAKGSTIISMIYSYAKQGSPSVQILVNRILRQVLAPFANFLRQWVYHGELNDQHGEFFIDMNPQAKDEVLWSDRYVLNKEMVPGFMDLELAQKVLTTGKSVNFMRKCCKVSDWVLNIEFIDLSSALISNVNQTLNFTEFRNWVINAKEITSNVLLKVLSEKFKFIQHLGAIKKFLLFGQGDFIQYLMDLLIKELSQPATSIYRHNLVPLLEGAIRSSNAQYIDNELLNRIDVKLLAPSPGDSGWDIFSLTYRVDSPLSTILTPEVMKGYLQLFNFFWRIKRIEHSLTSIWTQHMKGAKLMDRMKEFKVHIHKCNLLRNEMIHFVGNLFSYLMIEVIESSWKTLMDELQEAKDLDDVIRYHKKFVDSMLEKALLTPKSDKIYKQMAKLFDYIYRFKCTQEILMTSVQEEEHRRVAEKNRAEMMEILEQENNQSHSYDDTDRGGLEIEEPGKAAARDRMRTETLSTLGSVWKDYKVAFVEFMDLIRDGGLNGRLRFLSFKLDFNEYYSSINPRNIEVRDKNIEAFRILKNSNESMNFNNYKPRTEVISPPKAPEEEKMLTESITQGYKPIFAQSGSYLGMNTSPPKETGTLPRPTEMDIGQSYRPYTGVTGQSGSFLGNFGMSTSPPKETGTVPRPTEMDIGQNYRPFTTGQSGSLLGMSTSPPKETGTLPRPADMDIGQGYRPYSGVTGQSGSFLSMNTSPPKETGTVLRPGDIDLGLSNGGGSYGGVDFNQIQQNLDRFTQVLKNRTRPGQGSMQVEGDADSYLRTLNYGLRPENRQENKSVSKGFNDQSYPGDEQ